jgi:putative ABC transport system permease protein
MFKNYLKTALRNLWRQKGLTAINVSGLSVGIAGSLVLFLLVYHHSHFDEFHANRDRIYRVVSKSKGNAGDEFSCGVPAVLTDAFRNDFPQAEEVAFTSYRSGALITIHQESGEGKKYMEESGVVFTQPQFFRIFDRKVVSGDAVQGLDEPNEAVISTSLAKKYFGKDDVIGETVRHEGSDFKISAVVADPEINTDFPFTLFLSYATIKTASESNGWNSTWSDEQCYFLLKPGEQLASIEAGMPSFVKKYLSADDAMTRAFPIQPLAEVHSDDRFGNYNYNTVDPVTLIFLSAIAFVLVLTACINFINLSTAEATRRAKEVGIRKTLGSSRLQLIRQFLGETTLVTVFSVGFALVITWLGLSFLNPFMELSLSLDFASGDLWMFVVGTTAVVALLSGVYPGFVMSAFKPAHAIRNASTGPAFAGYGMRRTLVVAQFFISQFLIIGTIVMIRQIDYVSKKDLGFNREAIVNIAIPEREVPADGESKMRTLREQVSTLAGVEAVSLNSSAPSSSNVSGTHFTIEGNEEDLGTQVKQVDGNYVELFGLKVLAGEIIGDYDTARGFLVNRKLIETAGLSSPADAVGKEVRMWGKRLPVAGVVENFHTVSLEADIEPVVLMNRIRGFENLSVRLSPGNMQESISQIQGLWEQAYPEAIFSYEFLDDQVREFYDSQRKMSVMLSIFTSLAIFIGCLGLFGLVTFMANQKTKEIGIRKVMGASIHSIVFIFSREFLVLIAIGFVLAAPAAWWAMQTFLSEFAYRVQMGPSVFLAGIGVTIVIAMVTVGYRSFRAAAANPVDSLRSE